MNIYIPTETEFKSWIREALEELEAKRSKDQEHYITQSKAAKLSGLHRNTISNRIKNGTCQTKVIGKKTLVLLSSLV